MRVRRFPLATVIALLLGSVLLQCQPLTVQASPGKSAVLERSDLDALPRIKVSHGPAGGAQYEGVAVSAVLARAGVLLGESLRGKRPLRICR